MSGPKVVTKGVPEVEAPPTEGILKIQTKVISTIIYFLNFHISPSFFITSTRSRKRHQRRFNKRKQVRQDLKAT